LTTGDESVKYQKNQRRSAPTQVSGFARNRRPESTGMTVRNHWNRQLKVLLNISGVDLPMASTILRFTNPKVFQIIDRHAYRAIYGKKYPLYQSTPTERKISLYFDYIDDLIELCKLKGLTFTTIDRLLYIFDKKNNGKL
jgi:thermostable 8-oxoguanine DNA glycosylase